MGQCIYCGETAGWLRRQHKQCREKHQQALRKIPGFFEKALASPLSVDRFHDLLVEVAQVSFISPDQLKSLALAGMTKALLEILKHRLLTAEEEDRSMLLLESFDLPFDPSLKPHEILLKANILRELRTGKLSEYVTLADPLPIQLRSREKILWTFNGIDSFAKEVVGRDEHTKLISNDDYLPYGDSDKKPANVKGLKSEKTADMLVTSGQLYLFSKDRPPRRTPIARIRDIQRHRNGFTILCEGKKKLARTIVVDDPWFATNLISGLMNWRKRIRYEPQPA